MGYASSGQVGTGVRQRIYARAFIVGSASSPANRFIYLNIDTANGDTAVRNGVLDGLKALGSAYSVYGPQNVAVVGLVFSKEWFGCELYANLYIVLTSKFQILRFTFIQVAGRTLCCTTS
jgi:hypothetical protein